MDVSIDKIFDYLSWNNSAEIQKCGITQASKIKSLSIFIMPIESKSVWENCAKVLVSKSNKELHLYLVELFEWLKDMNWPGADLIYNRLIHVSAEFFLPVYQYSVSLAKQTHDRAWEMALQDLLDDWNKTWGKVGQV